VYDKRSKPSERTKTEEEIAQEESERLQKLEQERLRRMRGEGLDVEEEIAPKQKLRREGDDLDDDFMPDEGEEDLYGLGKGALIHRSDLESEDGEVEDDLVSETGDINENGEEEEEEEESEDEFDLAQYFTDEEQEIADESEPEESDKEEAIIPATKRLKIGEVAPKYQEISFTYPCPSKFAEMLEIIKDIPLESIPTVIERIEILHSTKLRAENRQKLETFTPVVLKLILHLATVRPVPFNIINAILVRLHGLAAQFPATLTPEIFAAIEGSRKRFNSSLTSDKAFPTAQELILFYAVGQIYPPSDLSHPIINPATLFMGQILSQMKIRNAQDLGRGLFVCSLFLQYQSLSRRLAPEVINFVNYTLVTLTSVTVGDLPETRNEQDIKPLRFKSSEIPKEVPEKLSFSALFDGNANSAQLKVQVLKMAVDLIDSAAELWKSSISLPELFQPTQNILSEIMKTKTFKSLPETLQSRHNTVLDTISRRIKLSLGSRAALALQAHRPIPIPSYLPRYSMTYSLDTKNDPNQQRAALSKLQHQHSREKKSVIRELRKEARTEAVIRSEEGRRKDAIYQEKMRVATGILKAGNDVGKWQRDQKRKRR
jgi:nucleolar protein 14